MKTLKTIRLLMVPLFILTALNLHAQVITDERVVEPFTGVSAGSVFKVYLSQGDTYALTIKAPEEHLEHIETEVKDKVLHISYAHRTRNLRDLEAHITAPSFSFLNASGATSFESVHPLTAETLTLNVSGASSMNLDLETVVLNTTVSGASGVNLRGSAEKHRLIASGVSTIRAFGLETKETKVTSSGTSNVQINVLESIQAEASGTSSINVRGNPVTVGYSTSGTASISGIDETGAQETTILEEDETVVVRVGEREVVISEGKRPEVRTRESYRPRWRDTWTGLYLGINGYMSPSNSLSLDPGTKFMDLEYNNSVSVNLNLWQQNLAIARGARSNFGLVTGLGVGWNNYRFEQNVRLVHGDDQLEHFTDTIHNFRKNKLTVSHLNAPLMLEFQTAQNKPNSQFHMAAGVNVGVRLRSHTKYVYRDDGSREKEKDFKSYHLTPFRYEAIARIGWGRVNLFATYALNSMFKDDKGPELYPVNIGIRIINF